MAGRTRRSGSTAKGSTATVEPTETAEHTEADAAIETNQEGADEVAPETSQEADVSTTTEEAPAEVTETEAPAEAPAADATTEAPAPSAEQLYTEFQGLTNQAVQNSDQSTGTIAVVDMDAVLGSYKKLGSTGNNSKSAAKSWIADIMRETLVKGDMRGATALANINKAVNEASTRRTTAAAPKVTISPTQAYVERLVAHALAGQFVQMPEGLEEGWNAKYDELMDREGQKVAEYREWLAKPEDERGDEPEGVSSILKDAAKLGAGRSVGRRSTGTRRSGGGGGTGSRRDVKKHIEEFFATVEAGTEHTVAEIANYKSSEYPEGDASPGAVAARLFPGEGKASSVEGFEPVTGGTTRKVRILAA